MIDIRSETPDDHDAINQVIDQAFTDEFGKSDGKLAIVDMLRNLDDLPFFLSLVAQRDNQIVGHILFSSVTIEDAPQIKAAVLGPLAVLPEFQNKGIGSALVEQGLELCWAQHIQAVFLTGHPEYYPRFGFKPITETRLKTIFNTPVDMVRELAEHCLDDAEGLVKYPKPWERFL